MDFFSDLGDSRGGLHTYWVHGAGAPSSGTLAAGQYLQGDIYLDTTAAVLYFCGAAGSASTSTWKVLATGGALANAVVGVAAGYKVARGQMTTASASDTVVTGLTTVVSAVANMEDAPVIGADRSNAAIGDQAGAPAAGSILIKSYKPTATGDATPIAATTFSKKVNWVAVGT